MRRRGTPLPRTRNTRSRYGGALATHVAANQRQRATMNLEEARALMYKYINRETYDEARFDMYFENVPMAQANPSRRQNADLLQDMLKYWGLIFPKLFLLDIIIEPAVSSGSITQLADRISRLLSETPTTSLTHSVPLQMFTMFMKHPTRADLERSAQKQFTLLAINTLNTTE